jgi:uncharacterized protein (TIGR03067 family)
MTRYVSLLSLVLALGAPAFADDVKKDLEKFQGAWTFESHEYNGEKMSPAELKILTIIFDGDKYTLKQRDQTAQLGNQRLDPGKNPKTVDIIITQGSGKGTTRIGIYELDGDTLKVCLDPTGQKRPTEFAAGSGSGNLFVVLKRVKK